MKILKRNKVKKKGYLSYRRKVWKKFRSNPLAVFGLSVIAIAIFVSVMGSLIRPDETLYANNKITNINYQPPGFEVSVLKVRKNVILDQPGIVGRMFFGGTNSEFRYIAIQDYTIAGDSIVYEEFDPENGRGRTGSEKLINVIYALNPEVKPRYSGETIQFQTRDGKIKEVSLEKAAKLVENEQIETFKYWLGTDKSGRDFLSLLMSGTIISLIVGSLSVLISLLVGVTLGAVAGFFRGVVDEVIMWIINVVWSIPTLLLVIAMSMALGKGYEVIFVAVGLTMWVEVARIVRGQVMAVREKEFVEAGRALGFTPFRLITRHVLPNVTGPIIVVAAANFASAILIEAGLSYLGIGVQNPQTSWGSLMSAYRNDMFDPEHMYLVLLPGGCIVLLVLAFMLVGNALRDALDTKMTADSSSSSAA